MLLGTADVIWCYSPFMGHVGFLTVVFKAVYDQEWIGFPYF